MKTDFDARIVEDNISAEGVRLTTMEVTMPRWLLAEFNTHRLLSPFAYDTNEFSRNSASSRAIPPEIQIKRVNEHGFVPEFGSRVKGMGVGDDLGIPEQAWAKDFWKECKNSVVHWATRINNLGVDKSRVNRLLEPFNWHTVIVSATEWDNFFALRTDEGAQPEFRIVAELMKKAYDESEPREIQPGEEFWATPFVDDSELTHDYQLLKPDWGFWKYVSVRRIARVSFDKHLESEKPEDSLEKAKGLEKSGHFSPFEAVARPFTKREWELVREIQDKILDYKNSGLIGDAVAETWSREAEFCGNFRGWVQFRKEISHEFNFGEVNAGS